MAYTGYGGTLSGASVGNIGNIQSLTLGGYGCETISLKTIADVNRFVDKMAGSRDAGQMNVECIYDKTQYSTLISAMGGTQEVWTNTLPDGSTFVVDGFISGVDGLNQDTDGHMKYSVTIELANEPTFTPAD